MVAKADIAPGGSSPVIMTGPPPRPPLPARYQKQRNGTDRPTHHTTPHHTLGCRLLLLLSTGLSATVRRSAGRVLFWCAHLAEQRTLYVVCVG